MDKKPYTKPVLSRVEIKPDESVLAACKTAQMGCGPGEDPNEQIGS